MINTDNKVSPNGQENNATSIEMDEKKPLESNEIPKTKKQKILSILHDIMFVIVTFLIGFWFGFILEKCKVYDPKFIRQQMIFRKFLMLKMFCSALVISMLSILFVSLIASKRYNKVLEGYRETLKSKSLLIIASGGLILGLGMTIAGSCPGMIFVQMGAGVNYSYLTFIGGLLAALIHGLLNSYMTQTSKPDSIASKTIYELTSSLLCNTNKRVHHIVERIVLILLLGGGIAVMEVLVPWDTDYKVKDESQSIFLVTSEVWHPLFAGGLLGSLQFFSLLILMKSLGASSSYSTAVSLVFPFKILEKFPYLKRFRFGLSNYVSLVFSLSVFLGSLTSSFSGGVFNKGNYVHPYNAIIGGFLLVFGARLAGGCNTGHGISGTSHLFIGSIVALISMFASGIMLGFFALTNDFYF